MLATTLHQVAIKHQAGQALAVPSNLVDMPNGDTVQFNSSDGTFRIIFKPWPFKEPANPGNEVTTSDPLTFQNKGVVDLLFEFLCFITPTGTNVEARYPGTSGGHGNVKP